jgi:hypothetical protein
MIGIRITPNQEVSELNLDTDKEFIHTDKDGYSLMVPERWEHKNLNCLSWLKITHPILIYWPPSGLMHYTPRCIVLPLSKLYTVIFIY